MISVLIITFNEEVNINDCLDSVAWSDDVLVFDSGSTDKTIEFAKSKGARVLTRPFDNYGSQRQAALEQGAFKYPWLLVLDADERVDQELVGELKAISMDSNCGFEGFLIRRKDHFLGRWIPRSTRYPTWYLHFFKVAKTRYEVRSVHEHPVVKGSVGKLNGHLLHFSFNKGLPEWLEKHRRYAKLEAKEATAMLKKPIDWSGLRSNEPGRIQRTLKALSYRFPFRGVARFLYLMLFYFAFLDGIPGIRYSIMISRYENWVQKEMRALQEK